MSINWYEQHLEQVVKENQKLKFTNKRKFQLRILADTITRVFLQLFPEIPPLRVSGNNPNALDQQLAYYQKSATLWIQMTKSKLEFYEGNDTKTKQPLYKYAVKSKQKLNKTTVEEREICLLCSNPKNLQIYNKFNVKIAMLQNQMNELQKQINRLENLQEKYLKEISYLRSITKKMQYQLALKNTKELKNTRFNQESYPQKINQLTKEIDIWKNEYDRVWKQLEQKNKSSSKSQISRFDDERNLLNSLYHQEKQGTSTQNSNIWIVRCDDSEWSYQESQQSLGKKDLSPLK